MDYIMGVGDPLLSKSDAQDSIPADLLDATCR